MAPMNGEHGKLWDKIEEVVVEMHEISNGVIASDATNKAQHAENMRINEKREKDMNALFERQRNLPCRQHGERMKWLYVIITFIGGVVVWIAKTHFKL